MNDDSNEDEQRRRNFRYYPIEIWKESAHNIVNFEMVLRNYSSVAVVGTLFWYWDVSRNGQLK